MNHSLYIHSQSTRRNFLCAGALAVGGLNLSHLLKAEAANPERSEKSAIVILLDGGPSQLETFDPKPDAPKEVRGDFDAISTQAPGVQFCEHLPRLAKSTDSFALIRGVAHTLSDHGLGKQYILTGTMPLSTISYPEFASVINAQCKATVDLPGSVTIPRTVKGPGFLGIENSPFETGDYPIAGRPMKIPALNLAKKTTAAQLDRREMLRRDLDKGLQRDGNSAALLDGMDRHSQKAFSILSSPRTRAAFDLSQEQSTFSRQFESDDFSQSCLLAIRLIEAGVRCVTISCRFWDHHKEIFPTLKNKMLPRLDAGLSALFQGMSQRGLNDSTTVLVTGEFGRTPELNKRPIPGRDHYAKCMFMMLAGGGIKNGQVIGASDAKAAGPLDTEISPDDVAATFYHCLGIDPAQILQTPDGRPITLVRDGSPITELIRRG